MLHIIDDEEVLRDALSWLARSRQIPSVCYASGAAFLAQLDTLRLDPAGDCLLLDVRMPDLNGIALFDLLLQRSLTARLPVIFLTGHGDVPMAVDTLKRGAFDFVEKPFDDNALMDRVRLACEASQLAQADEQVRQRVTELTNREREVMHLILDGKMNKVIADQLHISMRTVEVHRAHVFDKMQVKTAVELARLLGAMPPQ